MTMLSPLKPLLCRHDYYWSERHRAERCRRCGKLGEAGTQGGVREALAEGFPPAVDQMLDIPTFETPVEPVQVRRPTPSRKALKAQAQLRRENLLVLLNGLAEGRQPSREEAIDAVLAVIEDAHSSEPVLFGAEAAEHFARLNAARDGLAA